MNILSDLPDSLPISMINLIGTHDSATAYCSFEANARCQDTTITDQLLMGIRLLDIRLCRKGNWYYLCHSIADCYTDPSKDRRLSFESILRDCENFLKENPREFILMSIKQDRGIQSKRFLPPLYEKYIANSSLWYTENRIPTLGECRGKIVFMRRCFLTKKYAKNNPCGLDFSHWEDQDKPVFDPLPLNICGDTSAMIQDRYRLPPKDKWESCAKPFLDTCKVSDRQIAVHFLSTSSKGVNPLAAAKEINPKFMQYEINRPVGWIFADFVDEKIAEKVMMSNIGGDIK